MRRLPTITDERTLYCLARLMDSNDGKVLLDVLTQGEKVMVKESIESKDYAEKIGFSGAVQAIWDLKEMLETARDTYNQIYGSKNKI